MIGTREVIIVDDTPNVNLCLKVHPVGQPDQTTYVKYDYLAVKAQDA